MNLAAEVESLPSSLPSPATSMASLTSVKTVKRDEYFYFYSLVFEVCIRSTY